MELEYLGDSIKKAEPADVCSPLDLKDEEFEEDFEAEPARYEIWILGYDENEGITDYDFLVETFSDAELAVEYAKKYMIEKKYLQLSYPDEVKYIEVTVETVVDYEGVAENVGTLFYDSAEIK